MYYADLLKFIFLPDKILKILNIVLYHKSTKISRYNFI